MLAHIKFIQLSSIKEKDADHQMYGINNVKDLCQISLLILSELKRIRSTSPLNHQKIYDFLMISGEINFN